MKCEQVQKLLTRYLLDDMDEAGYASIRKHLADCPGCQALAQELEPTLDLVRSALAAPPADVPDRLDEAHRSALLAAIEQPPARPASDRKGLESWWGREHPILTLAASLVLTAGLFWLLFGNLSPISLQMESSEPLFGVQIEEADTAPPLDTISARVEEPSAQPVDMEPLMPPGAVVRLPAVPSVGRMPASAAEYRTLGVAEELPSVALDSVSFPDGVVARPVLPFGFVVGPRREAARWPWGMTEEEIVSHEAFLEHLIHGNALGAWANQGLVAGVDFLRPPPVDVGVSGVVDHADSGTLMAAPVSRAAALTGETVRLKGSNR